MAFKRSPEPRSLEITSLIDIVFLLLIFFLVSFAFSLAGDVSESQVYAEIDLPKTNTRVPVMDDDRLDNLMVQIVPDSVAGTVSRKVFMLWPTSQDTTTSTRRRAHENALRDSTFAVFPSDFVTLPQEEFRNTEACTLISNSIARYVTMKKGARRSRHPVVEVRAEENTEFRILSYIMDECSSYDDLIPQIIIRTAP